MATPKIRLPSDQRFNPTGTAEALIEGVPGVIDIRILNKSPYMSDAETYALGPMNRAATPEQRSANNHRVIGTPLLFPDFWRFQNNAAGILSLTPQPDACTLFVVTRTTDTGIGVGSLDRAMAAGWFGGNLRRGAAIYWNTMTALRGVDYQITGRETTAAVNPVDVAIGSGDHNKWRVVAHSTDGSNQSLQDFTGGGTASVAQSGHRPGLLPFHICYNPDAAWTKGCDVAMTVIVNTSGMSTTLKNNVLTFINNQLSVTALTLGLA